MKIKYKEYTREVNARNHAKIYNLIKNISTQEKRSFHEELKKYLDIITIHDELYYEADEPIFFLNERGFEDFTVYKFVRTNVTWSEFAIEASRNYKKNIFNDESMNNTRLMKTIYMICLHLVRNARESKLPEYLKAMTNFYQDELADVLDSNMNSEIIRQAHIHFLRPRSYFSMKNDVNILYNLANYNLARVQGGGPWLRNPHFMRYVVNGHSTGKRMYQYMAYEGLYLQNAIDEEAVYEYLDKFNGRTLDLIKLDDIKILKIIHEKGLRDGTKLFDEVLYHTKNCVIFAEHMFGLYQWDLAFYLLTIVDALERSGNHGELNEYYKFLKKELNYECQQWYYLSEVFIKVFGKMCNNDMNEFVVDDRGHFRLGHIQEMYQICRTTNIEVLPTLMKEILTNSRDLAKLIRVFKMFGTINLFTIRHKGMQHYPKWNEIWREINQNIRNVYQSL